MLDTNSLPCLSAQPEWLRKHKDSSHFERWLGADANWQSLRESILSSDTMISVKAEHRHQTPLHGTGGGRLLWAHIVWRWFPATQFATHFACEPHDARKHSWTQ